ncbi:MAG: leucine-rich repeat protein [Muribaculaceae bacterium]|nr:leucine-rich repeat protein [Muribaculaceae bacterium]
MKMAMIKYLPYLFTIATFCLDMSAAKVVIDDITYETLSVKDKTATVYVENGSKAQLVSAHILESVEIDGEQYTITTIKESGFRNCGKLKDIVLPPSLKIIEGGAFISCPEITEIVFPDKLEKIGLNAFSFCSGISEIVIPDNCHVIEGHAFSACYSLKSIRLPREMESLSFGLFGLCSALEKIEMPTSLKTIESSAFAWCNTLGEITIPQDTENIQDGAFIGCVSLTTFNVDENNPYYCSQDGMLLSKDKSTLFSYTIGYKFKVPEYVSVIKNEAFSYSTLYEITLPPTVKKLGCTTFSDCEKLCYIYCESLTPPEVIGREWFFIIDSGELPSKATVYVPAESLQLYEETYGWRNTRLRPKKGLGVDEIHSSNSGAYLTVYTLDGTLILTTTERRQIQSLPKGIYIVRSGDKTEKIIL